MNEIVPCSFFIHALFSKLLHSSQIPSIRTEAFEKGGFVSTLYFGKQDFGSGVGISKKAATELAYLTSLKSDTFRNFLKKHPHYNIQVDYSIEFYLKYGSVNLSSASKDFVKQISSYLQVFFLKN